MERAEKKEKIKKEKDGFCKKVLHKKQRKKGLEEEGEG